VATVERQAARQGRDGAGADTAAEPAPLSHSLRLDLAGKEPDQAVPQLIAYAADLHASDLFFNSDEDQVEVAVRHLGILRAIGACLWISAGAASPMSRRWPT
jgi:type II secretory ATPase GspE/PulE/Tfp pilus assembly ATPase PilB-like protein